MITFRGKRLDDLISIIDPRGMIVGWIRRFEDPNCGVVVFKLHLDFAQDYEVAHGELEWAQDEAKKAWVNQ